MEDCRELIEIARRHTGLEDLGSESYREGLEILVSSLNDEANLNATGERFIRDQILNYLSQRLQVEDWYRRHPEIEDVELGPILFGVSLPRTGSTALSYLLSSDPAIRYLRVWESQQPCPPPSTVCGPDPRREATARRMGASPTPSRTPTGIDGAMECQDLMALTFRSQTFQAYAQIPRYSEWLLNADLTETYLYERRVLKLLQWGEKVRPWRLKAPTHILYMPCLDHAFPDARFVMTHRDPTDVMVSVCSLYADFIGAMTDRVDLHYIGDLNVRCWSEGMRRLIAFREAGDNDARFYDIHFRAMQSDPIGEVRRLYDWLGEQVSPEFEAAMQQWWAHNEERERYAKQDPSAFGMDLVEVRKLFADYLERMERWAPCSAGSGAS
ncbi:MAG: sulfotransferase [Novosphingobium sp.]|nr:sulfotransferase [Novosphingobium sp.]